MDINDIYSTIRSMGDSRKVYGDSNRQKIYGINSYDVISFEYDEGGHSSINIVCPRDSENNFMYIEINNEGINFIKIHKGGKTHEVLDLSEEDRFFQEDTVIDLGFSLSDYHILQEDFLKYYNGFLKELTIHL